jgi:hypothetical protein
MIINNNNNIESLATVTKLQIMYAVHLSNMKFCIVDMLQPVQFLHTQGPSVTPKIATLLLVLHTSNVEFC